MQFENERGRRQVKIVNLCIENRLCLAQYSYCDRRGYLNGIMANIGALDNVAFDSTSPNPAGNIQVGKIYVSGYNFGLQRRNTDRSKFLHSVKQETSNIVLLHPE